MNYNYSFQPTFVRQFPNPMENSQARPYHGPRNQYRNPSFPSETTLLLPTYPCPPPFMGACGPQFPPPPPRVAIEVHNPSGEEYDDYAEKEIAYKRFRRNDALMSRIMSEIMVPCEAAPATTTKLRAMKRQVDVLGECQKREVAEIIEVEKKHSAALQNAKEKREKYEEALRKLSRPITDTQIKKFSNYIYEQFQVRRLEKLQLQEQQPAPAEVEQSNASPPTDPTADIVEEVKPNLAAQIEEKDEAAGAECEAEHGDTENCQIRI